MLVLLVAGHHQDQHTLYFGAGFNAGLCCFFQQGSDSCHGTPITYLLCYICNSSYLLLSCIFNVEQKKEKENHDWISVSLRLLGRRYAATLRYLVSVRRWRLKRAASGSSAARCNMIVFTQAAAKAACLGSSSLPVTYPSGFCLLSPKLCNLFQCSWIAKNDTMCERVRPCALLLRLSLFCFSSQTEDY